MKILSSPRIPTCQVFTINYRLPVPKGALTGDIFPGVSQKLLAEDRIIEGLKRRLQPCHRVVIYYVKICLKMETLVTGIRHLCSSVEDLKEGIE